MGLDPHQIDHEPESISFGNGGWVRACYMQGDLHAFARFTQISERLELVEQYLRRPDGGALRSRERSTVGWGRLVTICNGPNIRPIILEMASIPGPDLARAAAAFSTVYGAGADHWVAGMLHAQLGGVQAPWPGKRRRATAPAPKGDRRRAARLAVDPYRRSEPNAALEVPEGRPYPRVFFEQVARTYEDLRAAGVAPNAAIATANKVPKTTADRWVRRARELDLLGPAPRGNPVTRW